jgi:hypothetical protein
MFVSDVIISEEYCPIDDLLGRPSTLVMSNNASVDSVEGCGDMVLERSENKDCSSNANAL